jgi:hypothetical protein
MIYDCKWIISNHNDSCQVMRCDDVIGVMTTSWLWIRYDTTRYGTIRYDTMDCLTVYESRRNSKH